MNRNGKTISAEVSGNQIILQASYLDITLIICNRFYLNSNLFVVHKNK